MTERGNLLDSISRTTNDYRIEEQAAPTPDHVDQWISQFTPGLQIAMLRELDFVFKNTYINREKFKEFLNDLLTTKKLVGDDPINYWTTANFLDIQENGNSQRVILDLFGECLLDKYALNIQNCGVDNGPFVYLDDIMFSGSHIGNDLESWINNEAPNEATIEIIVFAHHTLAVWQVGNRLNAAIKESGKQIRIRYWRCIEIENRKNERENAGVLWPSDLPDDPSLNAYLALPQKFPFIPRPIGGRLAPFSSEAGRQLLEQEFLLAGLKIRSFSENPSTILRPLGFSVFGLGFGSMMVTFRNCPNNCPLALWWGDSHADKLSPLSKWYPLFPRKTYNKED